MSVKRRAPARVGRVTKAPCQARTGLPNRMVRASSSSVDGSGTVGQDTLDALDTELMTNAIGQFVSNATPYAVSAQVGLAMWAAPDATGTCTLRTASGRVERAIATEDTYNPSASSGGSEQIDLEWTVADYVVGQAITLECELYDEDMMSHDRIGRFVLDATQLQATLDAGGRFLFFDTRAETRNALTAVEISAFGPMTAPMPAPSTPTTPTLPSVTDVDPTKP